MIKMGETADWLDDHPEEDPDMMADLRNEFLDSSGLGSRIRAEKDSKKRRQLIREAEAEFEGYMDNYHMNRAGGWD